MDIDATFTNNSLYFNKDSWKLQWLKIIQLHVYNLKHFSFLPVT